MQCIATKEGGRDLCQFWFSVWVSDLDLRRDQIENANFVHLTLFVIYWEMCTNSISGHHLQMAQGVARIDRTTPLSSFRNPQTQRNANPAKPQTLLEDVHKLNFMINWLDWQETLGSSMIYLWGIYREGAKTNRAHIPLADGPERGKKLMLNKFLFYLIDWVIDFIIWLCLPLLTEVC